MKKHYIIPIFVPHLGCPNDCVFCNQKSISGESKQVTKEDVKKIIEEHLKYVKEDSKVEVAFFGGSFTGIEEAKQEELLSAAYEYIKQKKIDSIRISTRPDYINKKILKTFNCLLFINHSQYKNHLKFISAIRTKFCTRRNLRTAART